jgi:hypothetical protein
VSLNNQREITLILKRDKTKSISAVVNKKDRTEEGPLKSISESNTKMCIALVVNKNL